MKKNKEILTAAAILSMSVVQMGMNAITPILSDIGVQFPELQVSDIQLLMEFPSIFVIIFGFLAANGA